MKKPKLLLTGGSGLLALNWAYVMRNTWEVCLLTNRHSVMLNGVSSLKANLMDSAELSRLMNSISPDIIVHTAGLTNVDLCEIDSKACYEANVEIARNVALSAKKISASLIHISTDHLFPGNASFVKEGALPNPVNEYGKSKLLAEEIVLQESKDSLVIRTNFFGWGHKYRQSLSDWIISSLRSEKKLPLFTDSYITPILIDNLVEAAHELIDKKISGVVNLVGDERISKYEFGIKLAKKFELPEGLIVPSTMENIDLSAKRPRDMSLSNELVKKLLGREIGCVDSFFSRLRDQELNRRPRELFDSVLV